MRMSKDIKLTDIKMLFMAFFTGYIYIVSTPVLATNANENQLTIQISQDGLATINSAKQSIVITEPDNSGSNSLVAWKVLPSGQYSLNNQIQWSPADFSGNLVNVLVMGGNVSSGQVLNMVSGNMLTVDFSNKPYQTITYNTQTNSFNLVPEATLVAPDPTPISSDIISSTEATLVAPDPTPITGEIISSTVPQTLNDSLACVANYSRSNTCDWNHWSEIYENCRTYAFPQMDSNDFLLNQVKQGNCAWGNWSNLFSQIKAR